MKIGNVLRYCQRLNEAVRRGKVNIQNLIALLKNYKGPDISLDQYNKISYALNTSSKYITDLLGKLEVAGISKKVNPDVYKILWRLLVYRGHEYNNFKSLNRLVSDRNRNGLKINEIPVCKPFSLIELDGKKLTTEDGEPNYVLASELANITGQTKGTSRGKWEVLLGIVSRNGNIAAQSHSDEGKGDVIVDRVPIEVKCSKVQGKKLTVSSVAGSSGVLGVTNRFGYRGIIDVRKGLMTIFRDYYNGLKKYVVKVNPMALLKALPDTFALKNAGGNFLLLLALKTKLGCASMLLILIKLFSLISLLKIA